MAEPTVPARRFRFETASQTDVGRVRKVNEDSLLALPDAGLWAVADGMGGHAAGDFASQCIVESLMSVGRAADATDLQARVQDRLERANQRILRHAAALGKGTIGATLAALMIMGGGYQVQWSGDSRVYRLHRGRLQQISRDHTEVQALLDLGRITAQEAAHWPRRNVITQAIGVTAQADCDLVAGPVADGDLFLICSDGLTEYYDHAALERALRMARALPALCAELVETALARGGQDNITVVVVRAREIPLPSLEPEATFPEMIGTL